MEIEVSVPTLLANCTGGKARFPLLVDTLQEALDSLFSKYPLLKHHVFTEADEVRQHVLICYNKDNIAWLESLDIPLHEGDKVFVMQLVSGG